MIKFFRKIRQNLLNEGKTTRYFKYAIGEIVLVVIGILIALQINNWNQQRLDRKSEIKYLQAIVFEIKINKQLNQWLVWGRLDKKIAGLTKAKAYAENSLTIENPKEFINAVTYAGVFSGGYDMGDAYVYDELVSTGNMKLLSDDTLKKAIIDYYANQKAYEVRLGVHASNFISFISNIRPFDSKNSTRLSEYDQTEAMEAFKTAEFRKIVDAEFSYTYKLRDYLTKQKKRGDDLIALIEKKLNKPDTTHE
jgi:hypothetical protein